MTWVKARTHLVRSAGVLVAAFGTLAWDAQLAAQQTPSTRRPELLVKFRPGASAGARQAALARAGAKLRRHFPRTGIHHIDVGTTDRLAAAVAVLESDAAVLYAQPNFRRRAVAAGVPNDPAWTSNILWGLSRVSAPSRLSASDTV